MNRALAASIGLALLVAPSGAVAAKPTKAEKSNAAKECRTERGGTSATREAFKAKYGTNKTKSNAFGKCVSKRARAEQRQNNAARSNAAKECKAERAAGPAEFADKYGTGKKKANAYGKCVSMKAKANKAAADARDAAKIKAIKNAAKACATERGTTADSKAAFKAKYGTNKNKSNAFGKCVSQTAKANPVPTV